MCKRSSDFRILFIIAVILIAGIATFFIIKRDNPNQKQVKGVFVMIERGTYFPVRQNSSRNQYHQWIFLS